MNNKKYSLTLLIISILVITIGITYAYYMAQVQGTGNTNAEASARTATIGEVEFYGEDTFDTTNIGRDIYPGFIGVQKFTIGPYSDGHGVYEIDLQATVPAAFNNDIKLTIYKTSDSDENSITSEEGSLTVSNNRYVKQDNLLITGSLTKVYEGPLKNTDETVLEQVEFNIDGAEFETPDTTPDGFYTYYAIYEYLDNGNQNAQQGLDFSSKITVKYVLEVTDPSMETLEQLQALDSTLVVTPSTTSNPDFSIIAPRAANVDNDGKAEQTSGLFELEDDYGTSYYFRGNVTNNYVKFGGYYWRIVRINGDGSIRMIYAGDASVIDGLANKAEVLANGYDDSSTGYTQIGTSVFNSSYSDNAYVGYMYGTVESDNYADTHTNTNSSTIKTYLDTWYENNLKNTSYESYIADTIFCNDRSIGSDEGIEYATNNYGATYGKLGYGTNITLYGGESRLIEEIYLGKGNKATLKCPNKNDAFTVSDTMHGNGALGYPVGLITIDEVNIAGGIWGENYSYYLTTGNWYWTGSPFACSGGSAGVHNVGGDGRFYNSTVDGGGVVRPVINLKSGSITSGNGTASNPYEVE